MIYIIIPVFNRVESTMRCLESVFSQGYRNIKVVIVDDGSTDGTKEKISKLYPEVLILEGTGELFWTGSIRLGICSVLNECESDDWIILANNDVIFSINAISQLLDVALSKNRKALVSSLSLDSKDRNTIIKSGTIVTSWIFNITNHIYQGKEYSQLSSYSPVRADLLTGRCLLHPVEIFKSVGNYDSDRFPHYGGDDEFTARAKTLGYDLFIVPESVVYLDTKTTGATENIWSDGFRSIRNRLFGIRSNINLVTKWRFTRAVVPVYAIPSYYFVAILKSVYILLNTKRIAKVD